MTHTALVAYGSKNQSTAEIAEAIGRILRDKGIEADVRPAAAVRDVSPYDMVVLGGAVYTGRWHRDARRFARRYHPALAHRPVWLFSSGPLDRSASERIIPPVPSARRAANSSSPGKEASHSSSSPPRSVSAAGAG